MRKENENIHIFIIEEEYRRSKKKQNTPDKFLKKAEPLILNRQSHDATILELRKLHSNFEAFQEQEAVQAPERTKEIESLKIADSSKVINDLDVLWSPEKMKTEEQALVERNQRSLLTEQNLHSKLVKEMDKKRTAINNLKTEILNLILSSVASSTNNNITVTITVTDSNQQ
ncbi:MAG TPA: hypothetical protein VLU95_07415 [Candidatus Acidoferrum sp.]|nr:hypothetical protein [Candidatus Acidoferrum sp.]